MRVLLFILVNLTGMLIPIIAYSQQRLDASGEVKTGFVSNTSTFISTGSSQNVTTDTIAMLPIQGNCKLSVLQYLLADLPHVNDKAIRNPIGKDVAVFKRKLLSIEGYVSYEYYYNQRIDTPYSSAAFQQHTERVQLLITIKEKYPIYINFSSRQSNNFFFKDFSDLGFRFDRSAFISNQKQKYLAAWHRNNPMLNLLSESKEKLKEVIRKTEYLKQDLSDPSIFQTIIHEREDILKNLSKNDIERKDSTDIFFNVTAVSENKFKLNQPMNFAPRSIPVSPDTVLITATEKWYTEQLRRLENLKRNQQQLSAYCNVLKDSLLKEENSLNESYGKTNKWRRHKERFGELQSISKNKVDNFLMNIRNLGFGRNNVSFSDLTVRNLTLTGIQFEYESKYYYALAGGKADYRFRDFILNSHSAPSPEFYIARIGTGYDHDQGLTVSLFSGVRHQLEVNSFRRFTFTGFSVEVFKKFGKENILQIELAKTKMSKSPAALSGKPTDLFNFHKDDNLAVSGKLQYRVPETNTLLSGAYTKMGYSFQSINVLNNNINRKIWYLKGEQDFFKRTLRLTAMLRQNDFSNPQIIHNYDANAIFKTLILSYRKRGLPFVSVGYFPGTQLLKADSNKIIENTYYMFNLSTGYTKPLGRFVSNSVFNYNIFINQSTDTGFVHYKGRTFQFNEIMTYERISVQAAYSCTYQPSISFYTTEAGIDFSINKWLAVGCGGKYNRVIDGKSYWGGQGNASLILGKVGTLQFNYDKLFIPNYSNQLVSADVGRVYWIKYF
jgi:hypothetical protein